MSRIVYVVSNGCTICGMCMMECVRGAISIARDGAHIDPNKCIGCGRCYKNCASEAIRRVEING